MKTVKVIFQPSGKRGEIQAGKTILEASRELGVGIESLCGGKQTCGKCKVKILEGESSPFTQEEGKFINESERVGGFRLACSAQMFQDAVIFIPEESLSQIQIIRKSITEKQIEINPAIKPYFVELTSPSFHDPLGDFERFQKALANKHSLQSLRVDYPALLKIPKVLREGGWKVIALVWMDHEILDIKPKNNVKTFGLALDIGTTTIAGYLLDLINGELIATQSMMNPQVAYGEDVMSRITFTMEHPDGLRTLHQSVINGLNHLIRVITERSNILPEDIFELTVVGNTAMHHLFLGINPQPLGVSPFTPSIHQSIDIKARDLGLKIHPSANVHILPIEAGFVGADNVGVLLALEPYNQDDMVLIIDIGTNGELVIGNRKGLFSSSCATGPALEGAHIQFGMRAAEGAIERIEISPDDYEVRYEVIGNTKPMGICGSGIIDGVAELYRAGIIDSSGRFKKELHSPRIRWRNEQPEFIIAWGDETSIGRDIIFTQMDIRNVQLAKAALYAGAKLMMKRLGIEKLDKVVLAGAFGSYIHPEKAMLLGMFPDCDLKKVFAVGNAAGEGARIALINKEKRLEANEIAKKIKYLELSLEPEFQQEFINAMAIPHMKDAFPHLHLYRQ